MMEVLAFLVWLFAAVMMTWLVVFIIVAATFCIWLIVWEWKNPEPPQ
jgi:hypothetical protein